MAVLANPLVPGAVLPPGTSGVRGRVGTTQGSEVSKVTFEKVTQIKLGHILDGPFVGDGPSLKVTDDFDSVLGYVDWRGVVPPEAIAPRDALGYSDGPKGRFEIIVRFTPEELARKA